jgi:Tfp pilus assembly protein PilF
MRKVSLISALAVLFSSIVCEAARVSPQQAAVSPQEATTTKSPAVVPPKKYPELQGALRDLAAHNMSGTVKMLEAASQKYPELPSAHVLMCYIFMQLDQSKAARFELEKAVRTNPNDPEPYIILGDLALREQRVAEAVMDFERPNNC